MSTISNSVLKSVRDAFDDYRRELIFSGPRPGVAKGFFGGHVHEQDTWVVVPEGMSFWDADRRQIANFRSALVDAYVASCGGLKAAIARAPSSRCLITMGILMYGSAAWAYCDVDYRRWQRHQWGDIALLAAGSVGAMRAARQCTDSELGAWVEAVRRMQLRGDMSEEWEEACDYIEELWKVAISY